jgi:hypothetical protein
VIKGRSAASDSSLTTGGVNDLLLFRKSMTMDTLQLALPNLPHSNKLTETDSNALPGRTTTSLDLPENLPIDEWLRIGLALARAEHSLMWWIGDWWAYGEHKYGDRKALIESDDWEGPAYQTCANAATVCRKITTSLRREVLGFSAHKEIAALSAEWHEKLLAWAADGPVGKPQTIVAIKEEVKRIREIIAEGWTEDQLARQARAETGECVVANIGEGKEGRRTDEALLAWAQGTDRYVRIDRQTEWGNPFETPDDGDHDEVIAKFEKYYWPHKNGLLRKVPSLRGKVLGCWCHPERCHGHIIADNVNREASGGRCGASSAA